VRVKSSNKLGEKKCDKVDGDRANGGGGEFSKLHRKKENLARGPMSLGGEACRAGRGRKEYTKK